jgi:hypothetical protein
MNINQQLPPEDLALIQEHGVPIDPTPLYVRFMPGGDIKVLPRGVKLFEAAYVLHGLPVPDIEHTTTVEDLIALSLKIKHVRVKLTHAAANGSMGSEVPLRYRALVHKMMFGTKEALQRAIELQVLCEQAGENVVPAAFGTNQARRRKRHE